MSDTQIEKNESTNATRIAQRRYVKPRYEVVSHDNEYIVHVFAPGVGKGDVEVTHERGSLTIVAARKPHFQEDWERIGREIVDADYRLQLQLNADIDGEKIVARVEDGIIAVNLPVAEAARPRQIEIK